MSGERSDPRTKRAVSSEADQREVSEAECLSCWLAEENTMGYELREHTADVAVEATGETLGDAFGATADGMAAAMADVWPTSGERYEITVTAENREALLFDYLDELIYERDVRMVLPVDNEATVADTDEWRVIGSYRGIPLDAVDARDLKAVTYSEMAIERRPDDWRIYVVFDV